MKSLRMHFVLARAAGGSGAGSGHPLQSQEEDLTTRVERVVREALELTKVLQDLENHQKLLEKTREEEEEEEADDDEHNQNTTTTSTTSHNHNSLSLEKIQELKSMMSEFWRCDEHVQHLVGLPEEAMELLVAAGYIRQDEWHELYPRMKAKQKRAKEEREANYHEVIRTVLSGEREREENLAYEGQDPDVFLENMRSFFDAVTFEYEKGKWKNVHLPDMLRDRSTQPRSLADLKESVTYSIGAPTRSLDEQRYYRRVERILFTLQDAYTKSADLAQVFSRLWRENSFVDESEVEYIDQAAGASAKGLQEVRFIHEKLSELPVSLRLDFIWTETKISSKDDFVERVIHAEYALLPETERETEGEEGEEEGYLFEADYTVGPEGKITSILVSWVEEPKDKGKGSFCRKYGEVLL